MPENTPPTDAQGDEASVVTIVGPYPMPGFEGCTGRNAEHCACATDEIPVCPACEEEIESGVLAFTATILDLPFLPAGHRDQSETWTSWHAACDQRAARPAPVATHTDTAAQAGAQALRDAADAARGMSDPVAPDCAEWADWLDARADRLAAQAPAQAPAPGRDA